MPTKICKEFSKYAKSYKELNYVQKNIAYNLLNNIPYKPKNILDLGCGSGAIYELIDWEIEHFIGVDFSSSMCRLHPKNKNVTILNMDFNQDSTFTKLKEYKIDFIISNSALHWSSNLCKTVDMIYSLNADFALSIFTNNTFKNLHNILGIKSSLPSVKKIKKCFKKNTKFDKKEYIIEFNSTKELFRYIKKSGVSGGKRKLNYKETKNLINNYPYKSLDFEVLFIVGEK
jgi:malonyl-CoA O-methyltransferase